MRLVANSSHISESGLELPLNLTWVRSRATARHGEGVSSALSHMLDTHLRLEVPVRHGSFSPQAPRGRGSSPLAIRVSSGWRSGSAASSLLTLTLSRAAAGDPWIRKSLLCAGDVSQQQSHHCG